MAQTRCHARPYKQKEIVHVLTCVVAWGSIRAAVKQLNEEGDFASLREPTVQGWVRGKHAELYDQIREKYMRQMERDLADRYRGVAAQAIDATEVGVRVAVEQLEAGNDRDPARSAANLAMVADKTLRDYSLLEGKPTEIRENRGLADVMRALVDMGVLVPHAQPELEASAEEEG
jgi:hypothetical protein